MAVPFANSIDLLKNQILNAVFQNLATAPTSPKEGQFYYNTTDKKMYYYNGTNWLDSTYLLPIASATILGGIKVGSGLNIAADGTVSVEEIEIADNLTTTDATKALSANQGKILDDKIKSINTNLENLGAGDMLKSVYDTDGDGIVDNAEKLDGKGLDYFASKEELQQVNNAIPGVIDNLNSTSTSDSLSANQGKILKGLIDALQTSFNGLGTAASKNTGTASGNIPVLDANGKLNTSVLPALAITEVNTVSSQSAMTSLAAQQGDVAIRTDVNKTFILSKEPASNVANWVELQFPVSVTSVNGKTGIITLTGADINATADNVTMTLNEWFETFSAALNNETDRIDEITYNYVKFYKTTAVINLAGSIKTTTINHNLNSEYVQVAVYHGSTQIFMDVEIVDENNVKISWGDVSTLLSGSILSLTVIVQAGVPWSSLQL